MATVLSNTPSAKTKYDAALERELTKAAGRIRTNDLLSGGLALAVLTLTYAVALVVLDKWLDLPAWLRQIGFGGFALSFVALAYFVLVRPLRQAINPRFTAKQVENTIPDAKNAVINWVDLRERDMPDVIRASVGARAVEGVSAADVQRVAESRRLVWLGATAGLLVVALAILLVLFKPGPFVSLLGRAFTPFTAGRIASRTELEITAPEGGDTTVTSGESLTVSVFVRGTVPDADGPDRVRLLVRHNPAATEYDELPLEQGAGAREWAIRLPQSVIQNGFWYKVAAGDARTEEHRVMVRSKPVANVTEVRYQYPTYTRIKDELDTSPSAGSIEAYRGTQVTITAKANREVKRGWMQIDGKPELIPAEVVGDAKDSIRFKLKLEETGTYRLGFTSAADEPSEATRANPIRVLIDQAPTFTVSEPTENTSIALNGQLKVNATISDDFGISSATLVVKVDGRQEPVRKKYREGKPFSSEKDGSLPTTLEYKDSIPLADLSLSENTTIEFWIEATDNCEPKANLGKSNPRKIRLTAREVEQAKKADLDKAREQRQAEEKEHRAKQDKQLREEKRDPKQLRPEEAKQDQPPSEGAKESTKPDGVKETAPPPKAEGVPPQAQPKTQPGQTEPPAGAEPPKVTPPDAPKPPDMGNTPGMPPAGAKPPEGAPPPQSKDDQQVEKTAQQVNEAIEQQNRQPGEARPQDPMGGAKEAAPPAESKRGQPPGQESEAKPGQPGDPMGGAAGEQKGAGKLEPTDPSTPKPDTKPEGQPHTPKNPPPANDSGQEKKGPPETKPQTPEKTPGGMKESDPGAARGSEAPKPTEPKSSPSSGQSKPMPDPTRGSERSTTQPQPKDTPPEERPGGGKADTATEPAAKKPAPQDTPPGGGAKPENAETKPMPGAADPTQPQPSADKGAGSDPKAGTAGKPDPDAAKGSQKRPPPPAELARETGKRGEGSPPTAADNEVERLNRDADDLNSSDMNKRQEAEQKFDNEFGKQKRQDLQDKLGSNDPKKKDEAKRDIDELAKKKKPEQQRGDKEPTQEEMQRAADAMKDLNSSDADKKAAAQKKLDQSVGKENRERIQQGMKDLESTDPAQQEAGRKQLEDVARDLQKQGGSKQQPSKEDLDRLKQQAQDLNSDDPQKREAAEKEFDKKLGKDAREQLQKDLKNAATEQEKQQAAQKSLDQAGQRKPGASDSKPSKEEINKLAEKANDLNSADPAKKKAAEQEFDKAVGQQAREKIQKEMKDRAAADEAKKQAAQDKLEKAAEKATGKPSAEDMKKLAEAAKDLNSPDKDKKAAAEKQLDEKLGKEAREQIQKEMKDLASEDKATREAAQERMKEALEQAAKQARENPPSKEDLERLAKQARDLGSPDQKTREAAEKALDRELSKDMREQLQKQMQDQKLDDAAKNEAARKAAEQMAQNRQQRDEWRLGGAGGGQEEKKLEEDPRNRLKTAELRLEQFEKNRYNKQLQDKLGFTPEQYDEFLKEYDKSVARLRDEAEKADKPETPMTTGPATQAVSEGTGKKKVETRKDGTAGGAGSSGAGTAPPGYSDVQRRFAEEAAKLKRGQGKDK